MVLKNVLNNKCFASKAIEPRLKVLSGKAGWWLKGQPS